MSKDNKIWLQVPTEVVRNIGFEIDEKSFAIYAYLLHKKFIGKDVKGNELQIQHNVIKNSLGINDSRTIKKSLLQLFDQGLIKEEVKRLPTNAKLTITLLQLYNTNWFTQIPLGLTFHIPEIGLTGYRLMYYYESHINRKEIMKDYCYPAYETIISDLRISDKTLTKYNDKLKQEKLITVTKHQVHFDNPFDEDLFDRYNNHYRVNLLNIR